MPSAIGGVPVYSLAAPVGWIRQQMPEFGARHCVGWVAPAGAPPDPQKPPIRRAGPVLVGGTVLGGTVLGGTGKAIRLHPVLGEPPNPKKPHIRLVGRIRYQAPCSNSTVGGTGRRDAWTTVDGTDGTNNGGCPRVGWVSPCWVGGPVSVGGTFGFTGLSYRGNGKFPQN